mgnify:CR=1 FL=1
MNLKTFTQSPFLERDGGLRLKLGSTLILVFCVYAFWLMSAGFMLSGADLTELAGWRDWDPSGRPVSAFSLGLLTFCIGIGSTLLGVASIAEERDRGTWREILLTPLSPTDIVVGKFSAIVATMLPFAFLTAPLVAWGALLGDVRVTDVALSVVFVSLHVPFFVALGIAVSAHATSVRQATTSGVVAFFALGVSVVLVPGAILLGAVADKGFFPTYATEAFAHAALLVSGTVGFLLVARERIASKGQSGFSSRRALVAGFIVAPPTLLSLPLAIRPPATSFADIVFDAASVGIVATAALCIVVGAALLDVASSPLPRRTAIANTLLAAISLAAGGVTLAHVAPGLKEAKLDFGARFVVGLEMSAPFVATLALVLGLAAFFAARKGRSAFAAIASLVGVVVGIAATTAIAMAGTYPPTAGFRGVLFTLNPVIGSGSLVESALIDLGVKEAPFALGPSLDVVGTAMAFTVAGAALALALAGRARSAPR